MSKILCPVDFSKASLNAIEFAVKVAAKNRAVLTLLNVFTEKEFNRIIGGDSVPKTYKELLAIATNRLQSIADTVNDEKESGLINCEAEVVLGGLHESIMAKCRDKECDMVVMGTTGFGKNMWMGSNTSHFIQRSPISVLCVPEKSTYQGFKKIIYATDIQEEDKIMMQEVISMATLFNSRVTVLHVNQHQSLLEEGVNKDFFDELSSFLKYDKIRYDSILYKGSLSEGLLSYMRENDGDLLTVYSKGRNQFENLLHKSVSKKLSVLSEQPLLVLK